MMSATTAERLPLSARAVDLSGMGASSRYAAALLADLGARVREHDGAPDEHPARAWARSGLMGLTGAREGSPQMLPAPITACADGVLRALAALGAPVTGSFADAAALLAERAALLGLRRNGSVSAGGSCRLLATRDGVVAVNLARADDWAMLPAWLGGRAVSGWNELSQALADQPTATTVEQARWLGLPVAAAGRPRGAGGKPRAAGGWCRLQRFAPPRDPQASDEAPRRPLVVDLSSLWAGPLCGQILRQLGARVIKVESSARPDGARAGSPAFFDRMNAGKASVVLDFASATGVERLRRLLARADIVIESSRPRALRQLGIDAERWLAERPGRTWLGISGHGRDEPGANWVAFGDDAGVGGGLSTLLAEAGGPWSFCGDAIADPLTGLHAALAAWAGHLGGGGLLIDLSMHRTVEHCAAWELPAGREALAARLEHWTALATQAGLAECRPAAPPTPERARPAGADTSAVLAEEAA